MFRISECVPQQSNLFVRAGQFEALTISVNKQHQQVIKLISPITLVELGMRRVLVSLLQG